MAGKPTKKAALPPRRPVRLPAAGRLVAQGFARVSRPAKLGVMLTANPVGERFLTTNYVVRAPLNSGVLKEYNRFAWLTDDDREYRYAAAEEYGDAAAEEDDNEAAAEEGDAVEVYGDVAAAEEGEAVEEYADAAAGDAVKDLIE